MYLLLKLMQLKNKCKSWEWLWEGNIWSQSTFWQQAPYHLPEFNLCCSSISFEYWYRQWSKVQYNHRQAINSDKSLLSFYKPIDCSSSTRGPHTQPQWFPVHCVNSWGWGWFSWWDCSRVWGNLLFYWCNYHSHNFHDFCPCLCCRG